MGKGRVDFERGILRLASYARTHGHANPKNDEEWLGWRIGLWVSQLRVKYRTGTLTTEQISEARAIGVRFAPPYRALKPQPPAGAERREAEMLGKLSLLEDFYRSHGHINVGQLVGTEDWPGAGRWISRIRALNRQGKLPQSVVRAAEEMNLDWNPGMGRNPQLK